MTLRKRPVTLTLVAAAATFAFGFSAPSAEAAPNSDPPSCGQLIGMRDAYYDVYSRTKNDNSLLLVVAEYTWVATDAGCFGTESALRQRAFEPASLPWS